MDGVTRLHDILGSDFLVQNPAKSFNGHRRVSVKYPHQEAFKNLAGNPLSTITLDRSPLVSVLFFTNIYAFIVPN